MNRVGHAFFKTRMRELGAAFGGEVSGHYYFHDFYCADSGTHPGAPDPRAAVGGGQEALASCSSRSGRSYFISGEINSEVEDQDGQDAARSRSATRTAQVSELDGISVDYDDWHFNVRPSNTEPLLRLNLESLVSAEHMEEKRDEVLGPDPRVSEPRAAAADPPAPDPHAVRGRAGQRLPDRGRAAHARRRRPELRPPRSTSSRSGLAELGHSLEDIELVILTHQHIDHLGLVSLVAARSGAEVAAIDVAVPFVENFSEEAQKDDDFAREVMLRNGIPEDVVSALSAVSRAFRAWGARADVTRVLRDGDEIALPRPHAPGAPPPRPQPHRHDLPRPRAAHADRRRTTCSATSPRTR